jgi:23S rRNA (cytosine1962-C5)-methyltransferase
MTLPKVILKPGKEKSVIVNRHPWIFSGAIERFPRLAPGELADVFSHDGKFLARGYFHPDNSIAGRILSYTEEDIATVLKRKIEEAIALRSACISSDTNCFRLINAEADGVSGLIVDKYNDVYVMQCSTYGVERLKPLIISLLAAIVKPRLLYEKSLSSARSQEGLEPFEGVHIGEMVNEVLVIENGIEFCVSLTEGQKTGLFLDHRQMRDLIRSLSLGKKVLNCFSYTGGFSLYALKGGASHVTSVDISESASSYTKKNTELNKFSLDKHTIICDDVFDYLSSKQTLDEDIIIIDPPAFAKKRKDIDSASTGYRKLNSLVLSKAKKGSIVLTSSCSYFIDRNAFGHLVFQAASECKRDVRILQHHILALDHPISLYHPEGDYLKSLLLYVV